MPYNFTVNQGKMSNVTEAWVQPDIGQLSFRRDGRD